MALREVPCFSYIINRLNRRNRPYLITNDEGTMQSCGRMTHSMDKLGGPAQPSLLSVYLPIDIHHTNIQ